ncbi:hypothetical protein ABE236_12255 [Priestia endophytica]|uniref:hypothetical protein n=1 Tax=Priestia endophytica TaxID=135735 RepID=UPI003D2B3EF3
MWSMRRNIAKYLEELIKFKWIALGIVIYFYGSMLKKQIIENAFQERTVINSWDISLNMLNDMYIIVYFIIPIILFISTSSILKDFNYQTLIRLGTIKKWILRSFLRFWKKSSVLLLIWAFMSLYMTINLPFSWEWSQFSKSNNVHNDFHETSALFSAPLWGFIVQIGLLVLTLSLLHIFLSLIYATTKKKSVLLVICVVFFILGIIGFKLLPNKYGFLAPTTYFSITKYIHSFVSPLMGLGIVLGCIITCFVYLLLIDLNIKQYVLSIRSYLPFLLYLFLCVMGMISTSLSLTAGKNTIFDIWIISFRGASSEFFTYSSFFYYIIVFFGLVYLVNIEMNKEIDGMGYYKIIRFRNLKKWFWSWFKKILIKIAFLLTFLTALSIIIGAIMGMKLKFDITVFDLSLYMIFYHFFINGFLQIVLYILLIFIFSWTRRAPVQGLILVSIFMILMLPGINSLGIIPVGLNSLVYLETFSPFYITLILLIANLIMYFAIKYIFTKNLKI